MTVNVHDHIGVSGTGEFDQSAPAVDQTAAQSNKTVNIGIPENIAVYFTEKFT